MRVGAVGVLLGVLCLAQLGFAADVDYELEVAKFHVKEDSDAFATADGKFKDRCWAVPGVEQSDNTWTIARPMVRADDLPQEVYLDFVGPAWLADIAWPRTRGIFLHGLKRLHHRGCSPPSELRAYQTHLIDR